jgi:hypothetical protein
MNAQQLADHINVAIAEGKLDPKAEVMISAPFECSRNPRDTGRKDRFELPVLVLQTGKFHFGKGPFVLIRGTDAWHQDFGVEELK